jgi:hypothetical protein
MVLGKLSVKLGVDGLNNKEMVKKKRLKGK